MSAEPPVSLQPRPPRAPEISAPHCARIAAVKLRSEHCIPLRHPPGGHWYRTAPILKPRFLLWLSVVDSAGFGCNPSQGLHENLLLFSHWVVSNSLRPHGLQHTRFLCPPLSPGVYSNSWPLSPCYLAISSSATLFFSCLQSFPASGSFPMSQRCLRWPKYWSFSFSISPSNEDSGLIPFRID